MQEKYMSSGAITTSETDINRVDNCPTNDEKWRYNQE